MNHTDFMRVAIQEAKKASNSAKFGCVIVKNGKIVSYAHNTTKEDADPLAHAEVNAIRRACKKLRTKDLKGCTLYTPCEPCPMCFGAAWWANVSELIYGVSLEDVADVSREIFVGSEFLNKKGGSKIKITKNCLRNECLKLYH